MFVEVKALHVRKVSVGQPAVNARTGEIRAFVNFEFDQVNPDNGELTIRRAWCYDGEIEQLPQAGDVVDVTGYVGGSLRKNRAGELYAGVNLHVHTVAAVK